VLSEHRQKRSTEKVIWQGLKSKILYFVLIAEEESDESQRYLGDKNCFLIGHRNSGAGKI
jgi:hypothetical protein